MVKFRNDSGGSEDQMPRCDTSYSAAASTDVLKVNGNAWGKRLTNGHSEADSSEIIKRMYAARNSSTVNGNSSNVTFANNKQTVNGHCKISVKAISVNGNSNNTLSANGGETVNGHNDKIQREIQRRPKGLGWGRGSGIATALANNAEASAKEVPIINGKGDDDSHLNGLSIPSENGSGSNIHTSELSGNEDNSDENQQGFIKVVKKKRNKNRNKNQRTKRIPNLPPGLSTESIKRDNGSDKNCGEKTSSLLPQKPPSRNFTATRSPGKSYSSVLANGQNGNSQLRNDGPSISSNTQNVTKCTKSNTSVTNSTLPETRVSVDQLSTELNKTVIDDTSAASCKQSNLPTKVEMTDVSAQTDSFCLNEISPCQKECLSSLEANVPEKASSPSDFVDVGEISDESSNAAYCDSVVVENAGESSNLENHVENIEEYCVEAYNDLNYGNYRQFYADPSWTGNIGHEYGNEVYLFPCVELVSNDSGRGISAITFDESMPYCCEFPSDKTSQLIGRGGSFKYEIEKKSGVALWVYGYESNPSVSIICMTGTGAQIMKAKQIIKERFRHASLRQFIGVNPINPPLSERYLPILPAGIPFMGVVSSICDPTFFWVQPYGHPHLYSLQDLERRMTEHFNSVTDAPAIENPAIGSVIAVPGHRDGDSVKWIRGSVINIIPEEEAVVVRYLDHGGDHLVPIANIRPMRHDFFSMPFFAAQCCLYDILPTGGKWSDDALAEFTRLCSGNTCPPYVSVVFKDQEWYHVTILGYDPETSAQVDIASHLVTKGYGVRPSYPATEFPVDLQQ